MITPLDIVLVWGMFAVWSLFCLFMGLAIGAWHEARTLAHIEQELRNG